MCTVGPLSPLTERRDELTDIPSHDDESSEVASKSYRAQLGCVRSSQCLYRRQLHEILVWKSLTEYPPRNVDQRLRYDEHREGLAKDKEEHHGGHQDHAKDVHRPISPSSSTITSEPEPDKVSNDTNVPHHGLEFGGEKLIAVGIGDVAKPIQEGWLTVITRKLS